MANETEDNVLYEKLAWHRPSIERIDIKRTMTGSGVLVDFTNNAAANILTQ